MTQKRVKDMLLFFGMIVCSLVFLYPLFIVLINSFKPLGEIISQPLGLPKKLNYMNYIQAWKTIEIPKVMLNTFVVTGGSVLGILVLAAMTSYWTERHPTRFSRLLDKLLMVSMLIPFCSIMIPLVQVMKVVKMNSSLQGAIVTYWGVGLAFAYFILKGAVRGLPFELEEAARIDGCGPIQVFFKMALPLLQPTLVSILVMDVFWIWNDFIIPLILLDSGKLTTIQLAIKKMFSMYATKWDLALPALTMSMIPIVVVFLFLQKKIVAGILAGAVKG